MDSVAGVCSAMLQEHLHRLRNLSDHPNRVLHYDQLLAAHLLAFFEPAVDSLRTLDSLSVTGKIISDSLDQVRLARSTLSDAMAQLPASALLPLMRELLLRLPANCSHPDLADLQALRKRIVAVDGSYFRVPADVMWALAHRRQNNKVGRQIRLDLHLDVVRFLPLSVQVDGKNRGSESAAFIPTLESGVVYLADRNFIDFQFLRAILNLQSDFVVRLKKSGSGPICELKESRSLTQADIDAGVLRDELVHLPGTRNSTGFDQHIFRVITVFDPVDKEEVRLLTTLLDVPAKSIGQLYRHRWSIELFFRWLKCVAKVKHLFCESANGITMQFYVMIIATVLMHLRTGQRPSKYTYAMFSAAAGDDLNLEKVPEVLERIARERELERLRRLKKKIAQ